MRGPHSFKSKNIRFRPRFFLIKLKQKGTVVGVGPGQMDDFGIRVIEEPLIICQETIKSFIDDSVVLFKTLIQPGVFTLLGTHINEFTIINSVPEIFSVGFVKRITSLFSVQNRSSLKSPPTSHLPL